LRFVLLEPAQPRSWQVSARWLSPSMAVAPAASLAGVLRFTLLEPA